MGNDSDTWRGVIGRQRPPTGGAQGRPRTCWRDYVFRLACECLGVPQEELEEVSGVEVSLKGYTGSYCQLFSHTKTCFKFMSVVYAEASNILPIAEVCGEVKKSEEIYIGKRAPPLRRWAPRAAGRKRSLTNGQEPGLEFTVPTEKPFFGPFSQTLQIIVGGGGRFSVHGNCSIDRATAPSILLSENLIESPSQSEADVEVYAAARVPILLDFKDLMKTQSDYQYLQITAGRESFASRVFLTSRVRQFGVPSSSMSGDGVADLAGPVLLYHTAVEVLKGVDSLAVQARPAAVLLGLALPTLKERKSPGVEQRRRAPSGAWAANEKSRELWEPGRRGTS
ncbi:hypothetical protein L3Q82_000223 [Scortum barcoo]|uniref:Uncharacterized protein n=1 Tax=Scortum barcoo TaxID=214431 RepID=A0ACB8XA47_9TELE|nr:hypothetical protein L3Q82_000223 [Scortum barcoo]